MITNITAAALTIIYHRGSTHVDVIARALWPDSPNAKKAVYGYMSKLRKRGLVSALAQNLYHVTAKGRKALEKWTNARRS
jgi:DNA-binding PadR family transcriptional regulator